MLRTECTINMSRGGYLLLALVAFSSATYAKVISLNILVDEISETNVKLLEQALSNHQQLSRSGGSGNISAVSRERSTEVTYANAPSQVSVSVSKTSNTSMTARVPLAGVGDSYNTTQAEQAARTIFLNKTASDDVFYATVTAKTECVVRVVFQASTGATLEEVKSDIGTSLDLDVFELTLTASVSSSSNFKRRSLQYLSTEYQLVTTPLDNLDQAKEVRAKMKTPTIRGATGVSVGIVDIDAIVILKTSSLLCSLQHLCFLL